MKMRAEGICRDFIRKGNGTNVFRAVQPTDLELQEGQLTEIIGRSGSGKTTFTNMLAGLLVPTQGRGLMGETDIYAADDETRSMMRNRSIGIIPQGQTGLQSLTVLENVTAPAYMYDGPVDPYVKHSLMDIEAKALDLLERVGIRELADVYSNELSGGELRRMSIARAMINDPDIIIADEPTADLDDDTTSMVLGLLREYADQGHSVLMVTHEKEAADYADDIYRMESGILTIIRL